MYVYSEVIHACSSFGLMQGHFFPSLSSPLQSVGSSQYAQRQPTNNHQGCRLSPPTSSEGLGRLLPEPFSKEPPASGIRRAGMRSRPPRVQAGALSAKDLTTRINSTQHSSAFYNHFVPAILNNVSDKILLFEKRMLLV